jgi:hypothetical protein
MEKVEVKAGKIKTKPPYFLVRTVKVSVGYEVVVWSVWSMN